MDESKVVSTTKMTFKPEIWKIEEYVTEISIPQSFFTIQPGESPPFVIKIPEYKFQDGSLSKKSAYYKNPNFGGGSFSRETRELVISDFYLPERIGIGTLSTATLTMKPFRIELLTKNRIIKELTEKFSESDKVNFCFSKSLNLTSIWTDEVDLIRITWSIHVQESAAKFEIIGSKPEINKFVTSDYEFENQSHVFSDVKIRCGDEVIPVHRFALAIASPVFRRMFEIEMKEKKDGEVVIEDIDIKIVRLMIKWIYTKEIEVIDLQDRMDLFKAAHCYQIESLKDWCIDKICEKMNCINVLEIYAFAELYEDIRMKKNSVEYMKERKSMIFSAEVSKELALRYPMLMLELLKL